MTLLQTKRMQLGNHADENSEAFLALKGLCDIFMQCFSKVGSREHQRIL